MSQPEGNNKTAIGILGGGQLSRMLSEAALRLGLRPTPFCFADDDPATQVTKDFFVGKLSDRLLLKLFFSKVELVTYESDFLPFEILKSFSDVQFVPPLASLEWVSDKIKQKEILIKLNIPSPEFRRFPSGDLKGWLSSLTSEWKGECVFKWAKEGYDGKGVFIYRGDFRKAETFCERALKRGVDIFAEKKINFKRELALVCVYSTDGSFSFYPLVISEQQNGICKRVTGPATSLGVSRETEPLAQAYAKKIGEELKLFGVYAVEFFEDSSGKLFVNEIAPRVHNSGHFTLDACRTSQFENHWRALLKMPLGDTTSAPAFAMLNLLGPAGVAQKDISKLSTPPDIHFHWYGKKESREGRKMGHLNLVCSSVKELEDRLPELERVEREWLSKFEAKS
ncbi:MAG: 5-(carboxyamino)imidazole ribonucleotide synthase [Bacteriovoracaceae bacterium]|nr:5-(carboxyamino)imidazole ribonucleotide synthase [Bacteriovoracaceae bacterium]